MNSQPIRKEQLEVAIAATSRAFWPDPLFSFFAHDAVQEHVMLPTFMGALLRDAYRNGEVTVVEDGQRIAGSASWLPPGAMPRSRARDTRITFACASALLRGQNRTTGLKLLDEVDKHHPHEPHWYLVLLGVDPKYQGRGYGGALLQPALERCDNTQTPAYLETQKPENLPFYERFGFKVREELSVKHSPTVWTLWREPNV